MEGLIFRMLRYFTVLLWNVLIKKHPIIAALQNNSNTVGTIIVTGWQEEEDGKTLVCDKCDIAITSFVVIFT